MVLETGYRQWYLLKTTFTTGSDPSFLIADVTWHLALESLMFLHETLLRNSLTRATNMYQVMTFCKYGLLTYHELKMAGNWCPSFLALFLKYVQSNLSKAATVQC